MTNDDQKIELKIGYKAGENVAQLIQRTKDCTIVSELAKWDASQTPATEDELLEWTADIVRAEIIRRAEIDTSRVRRIRKAQPEKYDRYKSRQEPGSVLKIEAVFIPDPVFPELYSIGIYKNGEFVATPYSFEVGADRPTETEVRDVAAEAATEFIMAMVASRE